MIDCIMMAYNDEALLPFMLSHYKFADKIHVIIDSATTDRSAEICKKCPNVDVSYFTFPAGFDDELKVAKINEVAKTCQDWIINVDTDEFAFVDLNTPLDQYLKSTDVDIVYVNYWMVYRHRSEKDLDPSLPALPQRRYGDPKQGEGYGFALFNKPAIARRSLNPQWGIGNHWIFTDAPFKSSIINGAHWAMADAEIAIKRRVRGHQKRQSTNNKAGGLCVQHWTITEEEIRAECVAHLDDARLF